MNKQIRYLAALLFLAASIPAFVYFDRPEASAASPALSDQVVIRRDTYGVPHLLAQTEEAAAYGMGYAQAEDHCVEVARRFISGRGEEAKYTGAGIESDFAAKRYGLHDVARTNFNKLDPLTQGMLNAYAAGFNRYVEKHRAALPDWIPAFDGIDVLARSRQEVFRFAFNRGNIIRALEQKYGAESGVGIDASPRRGRRILAGGATPGSPSTQMIAPRQGRLITLGSGVPSGRDEVFDRFPGVAPPANIRRPLRGEASVSVSGAQSQRGEIVEPFDGEDLAAPFTEPESQDGSNLWSIAGSRTTSGRPILLGNPHQAWSVLYWEAHVTVPGKINFYGATFVGRPMLTSGFNDHLGWTHTVNNIDPEDIYALRLDPKTPDHYVFEGKSMPLVKKDAAVEIKDANGALRTERRVYWYSHLGPVVHRTRDKAFAIKSPILDEYRFYEAWYEMGKTANWRQFHAVLKKNRLPMFNIGYADMEGNILYLWNGMVPKRVDDGTDYRLDVPGETGKYVWKELHRTEDFPQLLNPGGGYVQNCNDAPWWTSLRNLLDPKKYPSYIEPGVPLRLRSQMSLEMLESQEKFSLEDVMRLKFNARMLLADRVKPDLIKMVKQSLEQSVNSSVNSSDELKRGLKVIEAWDNQTEAGSRGGVLFQRFWNTYSSAVKQPFAVVWDVKNPAKTPVGLSDGAQAVRHFEDAVRWTRQKYGAEDVAWGEVHRVRLGDLDLPANGAPGEYGLFHVVGYAEAPDGKRVVGRIKQGGPLVGGGDGFIFAVEFSRPLRAYSLLAYGQTSNTASKHSSDQAPLFARRQLKRVFFTEAEIKANLEREYRP